jgi:hypothetical protein
MPCCGQGRAALRVQGVAGVAAPGRGASPPADAVLRYTGGRRVRVRGAVTGRVYDFAGGRPATVAASDAPTLVRTGLFARV